MRVVVGEQEKRSPSIPTIVIGGVVEVAALANLWVRVVLFLQEQVRDLRVQEFLRELVVGVAALSDLAGSILVKILHSVEGGEPQNNSPVFAIAHLSLTRVFIYYMIILFISIICLIFTCASWLYLHGTVCLH